MAKFILVSGEAGCGKSAVMDYLKNVKGEHYIYKTDDIVKSMYDSDGLLKYWISELYGIDNFDGADVNKKKLAEKLFDPSLADKRTKFMEQVNYALVSELVKTNYAVKDRIVYIEAAPIKEIGGFINSLGIKDVILVESKPEIVKQRLGLRGKPEGYWEKVSEFQNNKNIFKYGNVKNYLHVEYIDNSGGLDTLYKQVDDCVNNILQLKD